MKRMIAMLAVAALIALGACGSIGRVAAPKTALDFGPPVDALANVAARQGIGVEVRAPARFDSLGIAYRLAYVDAKELHEYAETRWAGAPARLVAQRLRQRLRLGAEAGGACSIVMVLDEFSQIFDSPEKSRGVLRGMATLNDRRGVALARTAVGADAASPTADARGGVAALAEAVDRSALALADWLAETSQKGGLKGCAG